MRRATLVTSVLVLLCAASCSREPAATARKSGAVGSKNLAEYSVQGSVDLAPSNPLFTAIDPFAIPINANDALKPARPFWYSVDENGLTILRLDDNVVVSTIAWPPTIDIALPDGEYLNVPAPAGGWEPVGMTVSYPTDEQLASNSETPGTQVFVVMARSGYEWASNPNPPDLRSPNLRDEIVPSTDPARESSMLVAVDVSDPTFVAMPVPFAAAILGHGAGQPAYEPATGSVYVGNEPSLSLPTTGAVPNDLTSFVSVVFGLASPAGEAGEIGPPSPPQILILCGPEHPEEGILKDVPEAWACIAEGGEGPFKWEYRNLPPWLVAHPDKLTGVLDGILYGTPPADGSYTFDVRVTDYSIEPSGFTTDWASITLNVMPTGVIGEAEAEFEVGIPGGIAIEGTGTCEFAPTGSVGSLVPQWFDVVAIPGRDIPNPTVPGGIEHTIGCVVMGTPPISGEYYEFAMPNFKFAYPFDREPVIISGQVGGPYTFTPVPAGVSLSGMGWHQIEKIHDPSTEADILNAEFFAVEPYTGQLYQVLLPQGALEVGDIVSAPATQGELNELIVLATSEQVLTALTTARPDIAAVLAANPGLRVKFADLVVEANVNPTNIYVTAREISDPTGADPTVIPIGGPAGSQIPMGALLKVTGVRPEGEPAEIAVSAISPIALDGVQAYSLGLDSNLAPAAPGGLEPGQVDHGILWVSGTTTGNVAVIDTALAQVAQSLAVAGAESLGNVAVDFSNGSAYVAGKSLHNVTIFGTGAGGPAPRAPRIWGGTAEHGLELTFNVGIFGSTTVTTTGWPVPVITLAGTLPDGLSFVDHGDGNATISGTPAEGTDATGTYSLTLNAANGVLPNATQPVMITVMPTPVTPVITSVSSATFSVGVPGSFTVTATGEPLPMLSATGTLPAGLTFIDNYDGTAILSGTPAAGSAGLYVLTIKALNGWPPDAIQTFMLSVTAPPVITSAGTATFFVGAPGSFTVTVIGLPVPTLSHEGALPGGVTFTDNGDGTATLAGTADAAGVYPFLIRAANGLLPNATQAFVLTVRSPPATGVTLTPSLPSPQLAGTAIDFTAQGIGSSGYDYQFWLHDGVRWQMVQDYGNGPVWTMPASTPIGSYKVSVYVRTSPDVKVDALKVVTYNLRGATSPATGVLLTASQPSPATFGTPVVFTAEGQGGSGSYQYQFWLKTGSTWAMVQNYGVGVSWTMPGSTAAGKYIVSVYVRTDPAVAVDALKTMAYEIRPAPATGVTLTASAPSPHPQGTPVVFTAAGEGSSGYQYRFWLKTGSTWSVVQDYGAANTWTLPGSTPAGTYYVSVYVRTSSAVPLDAFKVMPYVVQ